MFVSFETHPQRVPSEAWIKPAIAGKQCLLLERGIVVNYVLLLLYELIFKQQDTHTGHFKDLRSAGI